MFLATTALLLQLAIPSHAVLTVTVDAPNASAPETISAPLETKNAASPETAAAPSAVLSAAVEPDPNVTYMPGSLVLEPVTPVTSAESSSFNLPMIAVILPSEKEEKEIRWEHRQKKIWTALSITQSGAATFDAWSTRRVISSGQGQELNPMLRPFAGNDSLYAVIQVGPLVLDYIGHRMMTSHHGWEKHTWWIPQAVGTALSLASGANNLGVHSTP